MAGRGGYRKPSGAQGASGPGKFSKRTDAQKVQTPGLRDPDMQYGDVQKLEATQKVAPLPNGTRPPLSKERRLRGEPMQKGNLPSYLFETPSALPESPDTTGLSSGPGGGPEVLDDREPMPDERELVMDWLYRTYGNQDAEQWLIDYRNEQAALGQRQSLVGMPGSTPFPAEPTATTPTEPTATPPEGAV